MFEAEEEEEKLDLVYVLVKDGVVIEKQLDKRDGYIETSGSVICGMLYNGKEFSFPDNAAETERNNLKFSAMDELNASDMVALRCVKACIEFPQEWRDYVLSLRQIVSGASDKMPIKPTYPKET